MEKTFHSKKSSLWILLGFYLIIAAILASMLSNEQSIIRYGAILALIYVAWMIYGIVERMIHGAQRLIVTQEQLTIRPNLTGNIKPIVVPTKDVLMIRNSEQLVILTINHYASLRRSVTGKWRGTLFDLSQNDQSATGDLIIQVSDLGDGDASSVVAAIHAVCPDAKVGGA